jgi:putative nucleotidyltransferase-like protein
MKAGNQDFVLERMLAALSGDRAAVHRICSEVEDWSAFLATAARNGLHDVVLTAVTESGWVLPTAVQKHASRHQMGERLLQQELRKALSEALIALSEARVRVACLKGPVLAERLYPAPVIRPSTDLDLLVPARDVYRAASALEALGYQGAQGPAERYYREHHHHLHFQRPQGPLLELHFRAFSGFGTSLDADALFERGQRYHSADLPETVVLAPEDEFIYLAAHVASHLFLRLAWLYDLKLLTLRHPNLDWTTIVKRAHSLGLSGAVSYAAALVRRLNARIPDVFRHAAVGSRLPRLLLLAAQHGAPDAATTHLARILFLATLCDGTRTRTSFLQHHLLRGARKLAHRHVPRLVPEEWAG